MSDLSDQDIDAITGLDVRLVPSVTARQAVAMARELQCHRAAQRADAERVRSVVRKAVVGELDTSDTPSEDIDAIADRVAAEIATAAPVPVPVPTKRHAPDCEYVPMQRPCSCQPTAAPASAPVLSAEERDLLKKMRDSYVRIVRHDYVALIDKLDRLLGGSR